MRVTHAQFTAARENLGRYRDSVLADSQKMLEGMRLSYREGAGSLLELLAAQRSADDAVSPLCWPRLTWPPPRCSFN